MQVRLAGIVTPKGLPGVGGQKVSYGQRARGYLRELLLNKIVFIRAYGSDIEDRIVAELYLNGRNVNIEMVREGFAKVYSEGLQVDLDLNPYRKAEQEARKAERGIWISGDR